ncbi:hypothetical protein MIV023R [Invertebrate iridescent virus 3]|uniref:Uncharacterized protein 023R n=1 Tax=Invertebrate iridescent virus 3 TaxID=345201 RepID=023R_IIV3|nr:hypothetical protein MIV023R [Invertebrate iridescent virus 3]Q197D7.1 RecName: Full=Uncharacterized protein 023R [Invertebrate iridescent virus 3]ABF82053.1 hypothetical protein MIV023R [Invertebrate iridescent virus 3]
MGSYMLFDSLIKLVENRNPLNHEQKLWLIDVINNTLNLEGKEKLYSLLIVHNKQQTKIYDPKEPFYDIEKIPVQLQLVWYEFTKMHLKSQNEDRRRKMSLYAGRSP